MTEAAIGAATGAKPDVPVVFSTHALCKVYRSGDVEMEIRQGKFVVLLGASEDLQRRQRDEDALSCFKISRSEPWCSVRH